MTNMVLEGIRVVDWTQFLAGPAASLRLAFLGAEVIHVEQPKVGDGSRGIQAVLGVSQKLGSGSTAYWESLNYNKKSITVDLTKPKGREIIYRLVEKSDIFITNQLPDTIEKLGMDYESVLKYNHQLIYGTVTILGPKGPYRLVPGWDPLGQASSGIMAVTGSLDGPPRMAAAGIADHASDLVLTLGILTALFYRERTGKGQRVETSQLQAGMNGLLFAPLGQYFLLGTEMRDIPREDLPNPLTGWYECKDGRWIQLSGVTDKYWPNLCNVIEKLDLIHDPRFVNMEKRRENHKELIRIFDQVFAEKTLEEWREEFKGADVPFYLVNRLCDLPSDPQVIANDYLFTFDHPNLGHIQCPGLPFSLSETPGFIKSPAPELGQHTEEILLELGYSWEEISKLHAEEVV